MEEYDKIIEKLKNEHPIEEEVSFNEFNLYEKLEKNAFLLVQYGEFLNKERAEYEYIEGLRDKLIGQRYDYYRFEYDKSLQKTEIEKYYLVKDEKIIKMNSILNKQKARVDFFEICVSALTKQGWNMKSYSENMRKGL